MAAMSNISKAALETRRLKFQPGTRVELVSMSDRYTDLKPGDRGEVTSVDAIGTVFVNWDSGSMLGVAYGADKIRNLFTDQLSIDTFDRLMDAYRAKSIDCSSALSSDNQYFNDIFINDLADNEIYVDAGVGYVGTIVDFIFYTKGKYRKIYAFEPNPSTYFGLAEQLSDLRDVVVIQSGLYNFDGELTFEMGDGGSKVVKGGDTPVDTLPKIKVLKLDDFLQEPPTFIKMDIEGSEYNALLGAQKLIREHKPKLAICAYHKNDDLIKLPLLIRELVPEYKLYLRHHSANLFETVLYAKV